MDCLYFSCYYNFIFAFFRTELFKRTNKYIKENRKDNQRKVVVKSNIVVINKARKLYVETKEIDFLILFNPGSLGFTTLTGNWEWVSILKGIANWLKEGNYKFLIKKYERVNTLIDAIKDIVTCCTYSAKELATEINWLISWNKTIKILLTGDSLGAIFTNEVMKSLKNNERVYAIHSGCPFWYTKNLMQKKILILDNNGDTPDLLYKGDFSGIINTLIRTKKFKKRGYLEYIGHSYSWNHETVRNKILEFFSEEILGNNNVD